MTPPKDEFCGQHGRFEEKIDHIADSLEEMHETLKEISAGLTSLSTRVTRVEDKVSIIWAILASSGLAVLGFVIKTVMEAFRNA